MTVFMVSLTHSLLFLLCSSPHLCPFERVQNYRSFMSCVLTLPLPGYFSSPMSSLSDVSHLCFPSLTSQWRPQPSRLKWSVSYCLSVAMFIFFTTLCEIRGIVTLTFFFFPIWKSSLTLTLQIPVLPFPVTINLRKIALIFLRFGFIVYKMRTVLFLVLLL